MTQRITLLRCAVLDGEDPRISPRRCWAVWATMLRIAPGVVPRRCCASRLGGAATTLRIALGVVATMLRIALGCCASRDDDAARRAL
ncbi:hypothetical protein [Mesorhizobium captivum]|uniref:hypothetical protein n=1 Tax=Mesorhizobium captivum TaxID=3072319 RepID=UPI002A24F26D|nr:hypothetical protein [Mesorhizobium sp. VK22E]MDX8509097.1 hypothetical protein [Mesorhizobium sp. VK22E]